MRNPLTTWAIPGKIGKWKHIPSLNHIRVFLFGSRVAIGGVSRLTVGVSWLVGWFGLAWLGRAWFDVVGFKVCRHPGLTTVLGVASLSILFNHRSFQKLDLFPTGV